MTCVNCGANSALDSLCQNCGLDPRIRESVVDKHLDALRVGQTTVRSCCDFVSRGEAGSLALALGLLITTIGVLSLATLGVTLLLVVGAVLSVRVTEVRSRGLLRRVTHEAEPVLAGVLKTAAFRLDVPPCSAFIMGAPEPNAYTSGFWGQHWIVIHSKLLDLLSPDEIQFVLGHELGHVKREHVTWMVLASPRSWVPVRVVIDLFFNDWLLKAEYTADRAGLLACRRLDSAITALLKLVYWDRPFTIEQALSELSTTPEGPLGRISELLGSHPFILNRVRNIQRYHAELVHQGVLAS